MPPCPSRSRMTNLPTVVPVKSGESRAAGFDCIRGSAIEVADRRARRLPLALQHDEGGWSRKRFSWVPDPLSGILLLVPRGSNPASAQHNLSAQLRGHLELQWVRRVGWAIAGPDAGVTSKRL